jgi:hypothetical protein
VQGHVVDQNSWITIPMKGPGGAGVSLKYCFRLSSARVSTNWAIQIDVRSTEAKRSTLRTKKVYKDALAQLKTGLVISISRSLC